MGSQITSEQAIAELRSVHTRIRTTISRVAAKRSWRQSEKLMALATYRQELAAIELAIEALKLNPGLTGELLN